jgi:hypothetical protein
MPYLLDLISFIEFIDDSDCEVHERGPAGLTPLNNLGWKFYASVFFHKAIDLIDQLAA